MSKYRTALGKTVDMSVLSTKNERVRAVGNMSVNARGDTIDAQGRIVTPVTEKVNEKYSQTVGNRSANPVKKSMPDSKKNPAAQPIPPQAKQEELIELSQFEKELEESMQEDAEIEQIKQEEIKTQQKKGKK